MVVASVREEYRTRETVLPLCIKKFYIINVTYTDIRDDSYQCPQKSSLILQYTEHEATMFISLDLTHFNSSFFLSIHMHAFYLPVFLFSLFCYLPFMLFSLCWAHERFTHTNNPLFTREKPVIMSILILTS